MQKRLIANLLNPTLHPIGSVKVLKVKDKNFDGSPLDLDLTKRQVEVADRLVQGMTIALIADDLALTESRVNQIIRALKNRFDVDTHAGIVAVYQRAQQEDAIQIVGTGQGEKSDVGTQSLVPDILNSSNAALNRTVAMTAIAFFIAATLLVLTVFATMITEASNGRVVIGGTTHPAASDD